MKAYHFKLYLLKSVQLLSVNNELFSQSDFCKTACGTDITTELERIDLSVFDNSKGFAISERLELADFIYKLCEHLKSLDAEKTDTDLLHVLTVFQYSLIADNASNFLVQHLHIAAFRNFVFSLHKTISTSGKLTTEQLEELSSLFELGLSAQEMLKQDNLDTITQSYRKKFSLKYHPDKTDGDANKAETFKKGFNLYAALKRQVLTDITARQEAEKEIRAELSTIFLHIYAFCYQELHRQYIEHGKDNPNKKTQISVEIERYKEHIDKFVSTDKNIIEHKDTGALNRKVFLDSLYMGFMTSKSREALRLFANLTLLPITLTIASGNFALGKDFLSANSFSILQPAMAKPALGLLLLCAAIANSLYYAMPKHLVATEDARKEVLYGIYNTVFCCLAPVALLAFAGNSLMSGTDICAKVASKDIHNIMSLSPASLSVNCKLIIAGVILYGVCSKLNTPHADDRASARS